MFAGRSKTKKNISIRPNRLSLSQRDNYCYEKNDLFVIDAYVLSIISSCENQPVSSESVVYNKQTILSAPLKVSKHYKKDNLMLVLNWVIKNYSNEEIKNTMNTNGFMKGENKTLNIDDLIKKSFVKLDGVKNVIDIPIDVENAMNSFVDVNGNKWKLSISIPKFEKSSAYRLPVSDLPIYIFNEGENEIPVSGFVGYQEDTYGNLESLTTLITEPMASSYLIYVVDVDEDSVLNNATTITSNTTTVRLNNVIIKQHKEDWINGRSEVCFQGFCEDVNPTLGGCGFPITGSADCYNYDGRRLVTATRSQVKNQSSLATNFTISNGIITKSVIYYIIFENDTDWLAPLKTETFNFPNGAFKNISYRSWQSYYDKAQIGVVSNIPFPYAVGYSVDNSGIKYTLTN